MKKDPFDQLLELVSCRHEATEDEVLDLLWCVKHAGWQWGTVGRTADQGETGGEREPGETSRKDPEPAKSPDARPPQDKTPKGAEGAGQPSGETEEGEEEEETEPEVPDEIGLFHEGGLRKPDDEIDSEDEGLDDGLTSLRIHGAAALETEAGPLARALRPLRTRRSVQSGSLDEERTIDELAQRGYMVPVWERERQVPFVMTLVVDGGRSTAFWTAWREAWGEVIRAGCRIRVETWYLVPDRERKGFELAARPGGPTVPVSFLKRALPRRQILLFSDLVAGWWKSGHVSAVLQDWARLHTVTVVTPTPPRVWERNAVSRCRRGLAQVPHERRARWLEWEGAPEDRPETDPVFLLRLEPKAVVNWAATVAGSGSRGHLALELPAAGRGTSLPKIPTPHDRPKLSKDKLGRRLERAMKEGLLSRGAGNLIEVLAAAPLTPGLMRLVQRGLFPGQSHEALAEVLYSRLIARQGLQPGQEDPDRVIYDFYALAGEDDENGWLRMELMRERRLEQLDAVQSHVGDYLADQVGMDPHAIEALVVQEGAAAGSGELPKDWEPFARVLGQIWPHLGGKRAEKGRRIRERVRRLEEKRDSQPSPRPPRLTNSIGIQMLGIPSGSFTRGSPETEEGRDADDFAEHEVTLTEPFHIAETPVTQGQWKKITGRSVAEQKALGSDSGGITGDGDDHPIVFVNWDDALRFCDTLTERERDAGNLGEDRAYTLPTDAQWEYACRAGEKGPYNVPDANPEDLGWFDENSSRSTQPVGQKKANAWGLRDCHGNAWEWCADRFKQSERREPLTDPEGPETGDLRVLRGGCWGDSAEFCQSADRDGFDPGSRDNLVGVRPVLASASQRAKLPALEAEAKPEPEAGDRSEAFRSRDFESSIGLEMVSLPPGTFQMGSPEEENGREPYGLKETGHEVTLTESFHVARTPVTQGQWRKMVGRSLREQKALGDSYGDVTGVGDDHPVYFVNWEEALLFCDALTGRDRQAGRIEADQAYTLPLEAQWEYACRAGTDGPWNVDGEAPSDLGWYNENSRGGTHPVGEKRPNSWGLHDCHGNVYEWCADWCEEGLGSERASDPAGPKTGGSRVLRGGSWGNSALLCRSAYRSWSDPGFRNDFVGFRPVLASVRQRAKLPALEAEAKPEPEAGKRSGPHGMVFVPIQAGTFMMGCPDDEEGRYDREDLHEVTLTRDFEMAETPVTQAQWESVMGENPSRFAESGPEAPAEQVSWECARGFCERLSAKDAKYDYRLPTEAEWEYACRAGTRGPYNVDGAELEELGWYSGNAGGKPHPVGEKRPNTWGLRDMHGNVLEWCEDWFVEHLGTKSVKDPEGPEIGVNRVLRGGSWNYSARDCRSAYRNRNVPGAWSSHVGFRPVRQSEKQAKLPALEAEAKPEPEAGKRSGVGGWIRGLSGGND